MNFCIKMRLAGITAFCIFQALHFSQTEAEGSFIASFEYKSEDDWRGTKSIAFYKSDNLPLTFDEANAFCGNYLESGGTQPGGTLVIIEENLQPNITEQLKLCADEVDGSLGDKAGYWSGAQGSQWYWLWIDGRGTLPDNGGSGFENWTSKEPKCYTGNDMGCGLRVSAQKATLGEWFSKGKNITEGWGSYICQMDPCVPSCNENEYCVAFNKTKSCQSKDPCMRSVCKNGANCSSTNCGFTCSCADGFVGKHCETDICKPNPCENNGTCVVNGFNYTCSCENGYKGDYCEIGPCSDKPCGDNGDCEAIGPNYVCNCDMEYAGENCTIAPCIDKPCQNGGVCRANETDYICNCTDGFAGKNCSLEPCAPDPCKNGGICLVAGITFDCKCMEGFKGDTCERELCDGEYCLNGGSCYIQNGTHHCECRDDYFGDACGLEFCDDANCNNGTCYRYNGKETFCLCGNGFAGKNCELKHCYHGVCENNGTCVFDGEAFTCDCSGGFTGDRCEGKICEGGTCLNDATCVPTDGSFVCECRPGYVGSSCQNENCFVTGCQNNGTCVPGSDGAYVCDCIKGYFGESCENKEVPDESGLDWWIWLIIGIGAFLVLCIITITTVLLYRRRCCCQKEKNIDRKPSMVPLKRVSNVYEEVSENESYGIRLPEILARYKELAKDDFSKLRKQFQQELNPASLQLQSPTTTAEQRENKRKNRTGTVLPYDVNRITLSSHGSNYINASFIVGFDSKQKFIATQAPLPNTVGDFWTMIWEQKVKVVVMLNNIIENKQPASDKYWPKVSYSSKYGEVNVRNVEEKQMSGYVIRKLQICLQTDVMYKTVTKEVTHLQLLDWRKGSVPPTTTGIVRLHGRMQRKQGKAQIDSPIVVHCSTGAGRTGMFIAYDYLLQEMNEKQIINCFECTRQLRSQRMGMIETEEEYIILHKLLAEAQAYGDTDMDVKDLEKRHKRMSRKLSYRNRETEYEIEFNKLDAIKPLFSTQKVARLGINANKNLSAKVLPYDHSRLILPSMQRESNSFYYNASVFNIACFNGDTIAAQGPTYDTQVDFWHAVWHSNVRTIIMLGKPGDVKKSTIYWSKNVGQPTTFGDVSVTLRKETGINIVQRNFALNRYSERHDLLHLQLEEWSDRVDNNNSVLDLIHYLQRDAQLSKGAVLIHCTDGAGRTGTFISIFELMNRAKLEGKIDVFRTVKDLRDIRPGMVATVSQYRFLYDVMKDYAKWLTSQVNTVCEDDE